MITTFKVRSYFTKVKDKAYTGYKYIKDGSDWNCKEIEEVEGKIKFIFLSSMNDEDIDKINHKWKHKLN